MSTGSPSDTRSTGVVADGTGPYAGWPAEVRAKGNNPARKKSKRGKRHFPNTPPISITSLTDMVTMLLVYLLKTFATNPVEVKDPSIEIPHSVSSPTRAGSPTTRRPTAAAPSKKPRSS